MVINMRLRSIRNFSNLIVNRIRRIRKVRNLHKVSIREFRKLGIHDVTLYNLLHESKNGGSMEVYNAVFRNEDMSRNLVPINMRDVLYSVPIESLVHTLPVYNVHILLDALKDIISTYYNVREMIAEEIVDSKLRSAFFKTFLSISVGASVSIGLPSFIFYQTNNKWVTSALFFTTFSIFSYFSSKMAKKMRYISDNFNDLKEGELIRLVKRIRVNKDDFKG